MGIGTVILLLVIMLVIQAIGAVLMSKAAIAKGYGENEHIWVICFILGIFGYLYVIALPDKIAQSQNQKIIELLQKGDK